MIFWLRHLGSIKILLPVALLFLGWQLVVFVRPRPEPWSQTQQRAITDMNNQAVVAVKKALAEEQLEALPLRTGVVHLLDDPDGLATDALLASLRADDTFRVDDKSVPRRFVHDISEAVKNASSLGEVVNAGRKVSLDLVICGSITEVGTINDLGFATASLHAFLPGNESALFSTTVRGDDHEDTAVDDTADAPLSPLWLCCGFLGVLLLPWLTAPLVYRAARQRANSVSALLLAGYLASGLAALAFAGLFRLAGDWLPGIVAATVAALAGYNFWACERIAAREE